MQGDVLVVGAATNVSWGLDIFEQSTVTTDGSSGTSSTGSLQSDLDIGTVGMNRRPPCSLDLTCLHASGGGGSQGFDVACLMRAILAVLRVFVLVPTNRRFVETM